MNAPRIAIAAPYPEGAAMALATMAQRQRRLERLVMPSRRLDRSIAALARRLGRADVARRLGRGPDPVTAHEVSPLFEPMRLAGALPVVGRLTPDIHALKAAFDRRVAAQPFDAEAVVAMPESALATFESHAGLLRVFHEVDGHPRARNEVLAACYGAARAAAEAHPARILERIEAELERADLILSPSGAVSQQMRAHGVPAAKLLQAHLGVDLGAFAAAAPAPRATGRPVVLCVGQISLRKGIPFLLDAARGLDVTVRLIGPVVDPALLEGAPDNVEHLGTVSHGGVAAAMRAADAFVFPTLEDAFGLVVVEAAASGLPVISTTGAGAAETLGAQDLVSVPIGDAAALRAALAQAEPLSPEARAERADRVRRAAADGRLNDWAAWTSAVLAGIDAHLAAR